MFSDNPYEAPQSESVPETTSDTEHRSGIGRVSYSLCCCLIAGAVAAIAIPLAEAGVFDPDEPSPLRSVLRVSSFAAWLCVSSLRLKNAGYPFRWLFGLLVPLVNFYFFTLCLAAPEGYAQHNKLDLGGKIVFAMLLALVVGGVVAVASL